jgi:deazaflavin-dependent oxidoreductase (nitroreductase family)
MAAQIQSRPRLPTFAAGFNSITKKLIGAGLPMGPNALLTVRGRKSGLPRTTPISVIELDGRRWVQGAWGETNWVRNLRACGEGTLRFGRRTESITAVELSQEEAAVFFADVLGPFVRRIPLGFGKWLIGSVLRSREILDDPSAAAARHPVFELRATS